MEWKPPLLACPAVPCGGRMGECLAKAGSRAAPPGSSDDRHQTIRGGTDARNLRSWRAAGPAGPLSRGTSEARAKDYGTLAVGIRSART